ncbi:MAG TPA: DUF1016 N-terminal domain-containing protein [Polyangiaceae bacterium]
MRRAELLPIAPSSARARRWFNLYWDLGRTILDCQAREGWGANAMDRLSHDLRQEFPDMAGRSPRNLKTLRAFAAAWPDLELVQRVVAQIPWRQNIAPARAP